MQGREKSINSLDIFLSFFFVAVPQHGSLQDYVTGTSWCSWDVRGIWGPSCKWVLGYGTAHVYASTSQHDIDLQLTKMVKYILNKFLKSANSH